MNVSLGFQSKFGPLLRGIVTSSCPLAIGRGPLALYSSSATKEAKLKTRANVEYNLVEGLPFARAKLGPFLQEEPVLYNQYQSDALLRSYLKRVMPTQVI